MERKHNARDNEQLPHTGHGDAATAISSNYLLLASTNDDDEMYDAMTVHLPGGYCLFTILDLQLHSLTGLFFLSNLRLFYNLRDFLTVT